MPVGCQSSAAARVQWQECSGKMVPGVRGLSPRGATGQRSGLLSRRLQVRVLPGAHPLGVHLTLCRDVTASRHR